MKKLIALVAVLVMLMAITPAVFATDDCTHNNWDVKQDYCYEDENLYDIVEYCMDCGAELARYTPGADVNPIMVPFVFNEDYTEGTASVTVPAGQTLWFGQMGIGGMTLQINGEDYGVLPESFWFPCTFSLTNETAEDAVYELRVYWPLGDYGNPDALPINETFEYHVPENSGPYFYAWEATEDGKLEIVVDGENWVLGVSNEMQGESNKYYAFNGDSNTVSLWVSAGDLIVVDFGSQDIDSGFPAADLTITVTFTPGQEPSTLLELGDNAMADGKYHFVAEQDGTLYFCVTELFDGEGNIFDNLRNYFSDNLELTVNGEYLETGYFGSVDVAAGDEISFRWKSNYGMTYYGSMNVSYENNNPVLGSQERPILLESWNLPVQPSELVTGKVAWFELGYDLEPAILIVKGENAFIRFSYFDWELGADVRVVIEAVDGQATLNLRKDLPSDMYPWLVEIGNADEIDYVLPEGIYENPAELPLGETVTELEEDSEGFYYQWIAPADGTLYVTASGEFWSFNVTNETAGIYGNFMAHFQDPCVDTAVMAVSKGDVIRVYIANMTADWLAPAGAITLDVSFQCGHGDVQHFEATEAYCHNDGNHEYWFCPDCLGVYTDAELTVLSNSKNVIIPGDRTYIEHVEGYEPGCHQNGLKEFWHCTQCMMVYSDEALEHVTTTKSQIIPYNADNVVYVPYLAPTKEANGHKEYWHCKECDCVFADAALTVVTNIKNLTILWEDSPITGDIITVALVGVLMSATGLVVVSKKRK